MTDREFDSYFRIKDTKYDRHRKVSKEMADEMFVLRYKYKQSVRSIADKFNVSVNAVMYNTDEEYRKKILSNQSGAHVGKDTCLFPERVQYKKSILRDLLKDESKMRELLN